MYPHELTNQKEGEKESNTHTHARRHGDLESGREHEVAGKEKKNPHLVFPSISVSIPFAM